MAQFALVEEFMFRAKVEVAISPHQYALKTKAGSRVSMVKGLRHAVDGERIILFVRSFYGQPSTYFWEDDAGEVHSIPQGDGGEQEDPLMFLLFVWVNTQRSLPFQPRGKMVRDCSVFARFVHHLQS